MNVTGKPFTNSGTNLFSGLWHRRTNHTSDERAFSQSYSNPTVIDVEGAGHFIQEEAGPELAALINEFIEQNPVTTDY